MDEETYFRNRSRDTVVDLIRVVRSLQALNRWNDSYIFKVIAKVCRETGASSLLELHLFWLIRELEKHERQNRSGR